MQTLTTPQLQSNPVATLQAWLRQLAVPVSRTTIRQTVENHPDFPSLLSLSDALDEWQVDNAALQLASVEQLRELPTPFMAYHTAQNGFYVLVESLTGDRLTFVEPVSGQRQTETLEQFANHWSGVVLLAEKTAQSGEADYATHRRTEWLNALRLPLAAVAVGLLLLLALSVALPVLTGWQAAWLLTKAIGLTLSIALVMKQLGHANPLADRFCQTLSKAGCESVLSAPAATVVGNVHWSDVGLVYFAGGLLAALWNNTQPQAAPLLGWLAVLSLPYVVFSIYYQARVARQWCALCLGVQAVLLIEGALALSQPLTLPTTFPAYAAFAAAFLLPTALWLIGKPLWQQANEADSLRRQLARFKNNPDLFAALLQKQRQAPNWMPTATITIGSSDAANTLILVMNPFCSACREAYQQISQFLAKRGSLNVQIVFAGCDERSAQFMKHLFSSDDIKIIHQALDSWFGVEYVSFNKWIAQFGLPHETDKCTYSDLAEESCRWQKEGGIQVTPTIYYNHRLLSSPFQLKDLITMLSRFKVVHQTEYPSFTVQ